MKTETTRRAERPLQIVNIKFTKFEKATGRKPFAKPVSLLLKAAKPKTGQTLSQVKMLLIQDVNGTEIQLPDSITAIEEIQPGMMATIDSVPASGDFVLANGTTLLFTSGKLIKIIPPSNKL